MVDILINGKDAVKGSMTVRRSLVTDETGKRLVFDGLLKSKSYIEEINELETERLYLSGVEVVQESFGTDEEDILYAFTAEVFVQK